MEKNLILRAWSEIGGATPMNTDCGQICGAACCRPDDDGKGGVCLLPDENRLIGDPEWAETDFDEAMNAPMIVCNGMCDRARRPFLCRIFPLCPVYGKNGWTVRMDARARAVCPLCGGGLRALDPEFVRKCARAVRLIADDPDGEAFLRKWTSIEAKVREPLF